MGKKWRGVFSVKDAEHSLESGKAVKLEPLQQELGILVQVKLRGEFMCLDEGTVV